MSGSPYYATSVKRYSLRISYCSKFQQHNYKKDNNLISTWSERNMGPIS